MTIHGKNKCEPGLMSLAAYLFHEADYNILGYYCRILGWFLFYNFIYARGTKQNNEKIIWWEKIRMENMFVGGMRTVSKCDLLKRYARCDRWDEVAKHLGCRDKNVILFKMLMRPYKKQYCRNI